MRLAILSANLGDFDASVDPVQQDFNGEVVFHRYTDKDFPPITGLTPRFQYRIPKLFGWQMLPGHDVYIWMDGGITFKRADSVQWYIDQLGNKDALFFRHPWRKTMKQETDHIEDKLNKNHPYITPRYGNGLHKEVYAECMGDPDFRDDRLFASTIFVYRNIPKVQQMLKDWWYYQSRYFTCDQICLPYVIWKNKLDITEINEMLFQLGHVVLVSHHKKLK